MIRLSAWLAIAVGTVLLIAQIARNYDNLDHWPTWTIDIVAAVVLMLAGLLALRRRFTRLLPVVWAFAGGLYTSSVIGHWNVTRAVSGDLYASEQQLVMIIGALVALCIAGIALALLAPRRVD